MSVACLQMVESVASGVLYSHHPYNLLDDNIIVSAVWGLGPYAVDGHITPDTLVVSKDPESVVIESKISHKPVQLVSNPDGGLMEIPVAIDRCDAACLRPEQVQTLAEYARKLEEHYRCAQDIEWAMDPTGRLLVLQTRPLRVQATLDEASEALSPPVEGYPVLVARGRWPSLAWVAARYTMCVTRTT